jgi:hypothetical protein
MRQVLQPRELNHLLAGAADQVMAVAETGAGISTAPAVEVDAADTPELRKQGQGAVDCHQAQSGAFVPGASQNQLGAEPRIGVFKGLNHRQSRGGDAVPMGPKLGENLIHVEEALLKNVINKDCSGRNATGQGG